MRRTSWSRYHFLWLAGLVCCGVLSVGCDRSHLRKSDVAEIDLKKADWVLVEENWSIHSMQERKIGYQQQNVYHATVDNKRLIRTELIDTLEIVRDGQQMQNLVTKASSTETADGDVLEYEFLVPIGEAGRTVGKRVGDTFQVHKITGSKSPRKVIEKASTVDGPFAIEYSLKQNPISPGESRSFHILQPPPAPPVAKAKVTAIQKEKVKLPLGTMDLLKVHIELEASKDQMIDLYAWVDQRGEIMQTLNTLGSIRSHRTSKQKALQKGSSKPLDLLVDFAIPVEPPLKLAHQARRIVYEVSSEKLDPVNLFPADKVQAIEPIDAKTARIIVTSPIADSNQRAAHNKSEPAEEDLLPNDYIQSDDPRIVRMAKKGAGNGSTPLAKAISLEKFVKSHVNRKDYSQSFASASEVAVTRQGDCTEHALLLAALCRAEEIPARVVTGLVYAPSLGGFAFHMWNEVWVEDGWIALDGTMGRGGIGPTHIKLVTSPLNEGSVLTVFLPATKLVGQLKIRVVREVPATATATGKE